MDALNRHLKNTRVIVGLLIVLTIIYLILTGTTVGWSTVQWDEFTDLIIANQLSSHPLSGHSYDGSQGRLPMYLTAAAFRIMRLFNSDVELLDLLSISRWISILFNVPAIWGIYLIGRKLFNPKVGLMAAFLLTLSPFFLQFSRTALTQGDAFTTTTVIFSLICFEKFHRQRTTLWLATFSFCLALAIASKFFLVVLIPALITFQLILEFSKQRRNPDPYGESAPINKLKGHWSYIFITVGTGVFSLLALFLAYQRGGQSDSTYQLLNNMARIFWLLTLVGIAVSLIIPARTLVFHRTKGRIEENSWPVFYGWLAILPLSLAMVLALFPAHIFNREILSSLLERFITMDGNTDLVATSIDSIKLYIGVLLFKLGLPFGILTFIALAVGAVKAIYSKAFLLINIVFLYFGFLLAILPLQQPFWLMSIYPLILITLSYGVTESFEKLKNPKLVIVRVGFVLFAFGWLILGLVQVYPTYGYYGYEVVGDQWLGNNSRGHRSLVVVTNDGSTEMLEWLRQNVAAGSQVVGFFDDPHIIDYFDMIDPYEFELTLALRYPDREGLIMALETADYLVVRPIDDIAYPVAFSDPIVKKYFSAEPIFQIFRGRGIYNMPVMEVYSKDDE